jgi:MoxR-like ATPase
MVSLFGPSGTGKTSIALQVIRDLGRGVFISTTGESYKSRVKGEWDVLFMDVRGSYELVEAIVEAMSLQPKIVAIDTINRFYSIDRKYRDLLIQLNLLVTFRGKVLLTWDMASNNKVYGHKIMRFYSQSVFRATGKYLIGDGERCKINIDSAGVRGCS